MTLMDNYQYDIPVDYYAYFSNPETVTATGGSESYIDFGAAGGFPASARVVVMPLTLNTGESITVKLQQDDNSSFSSATDVATIVANTSTSTTEPTVVPVGKELVTERYVRLHYTVSTGDSIPVTAYLSTGP